MIRTFPGDGLAGRRGLHFAMVLFTALAAGCNSSSSAPSATPQNLVLASVADNGAQGDGKSTYNTLSRDGLFVAFESEASNLGGPVTAGNSNIYLRDLASRRTTLLSRASDNTAADGSSRYPSLSDNAARAAFESLATNLVDGQLSSAGQSNVFVADVAGGAVVQASVSWDNDVADGDSGHPSLSGDGHLVAFDSAAGNLTVPTRTPGSLDVYVRDLSDNTTRLVSVASDNVSPGNNGSSSPVLSRDGRYVAFYSGASNLVANDTNGRTDVFLRDLQDNTTTRVSVDNTDGQLADGSTISKPDLALAVGANGRYVFVAFTSYDNAIAPFDNNANRDVFLRVIDTVSRTATTELVSVAAGGNGVGNDYSDRPSISEDGRYVFFRSEASNLVNASDPPGVAQYYMRDRATGITRQISRSSDPLPTPFCAGYGSMNGDGAVVSFEHNSDTVLAGDANGKSDVFVFRAR